MKRLACTLSVLLILTFSLIPTFAQSEEGMGKNSTSASPQYIIDTDIDPFVPKGWTIEEHRKNGLFIWDPAKIELYLSALQQDETIYLYMPGGSQKNRTYINGHALRKELLGKSVLNASVLTHLLKNKHLIPQEWGAEPHRYRSIFFWGTIYRDTEGRLAVLGISPWGTPTTVTWLWVFMWLDDEWGINGPAALYRY